MNNPAKSSAKKTVVITGGAGGIGRELCKLFARDNYRIVVFSLHQQELDDLAKLLESTKPGTEYLAQAIDLSTADAATRVTDWLNDNNIRTDVLVNNVGFGIFGEHAELEPSRLASMLAVNNSLMTQLCATIGKQMKERRSGQIMNVASLAGFAPMPFFASYAASKSYVISFSVALERELREHGVSVTCLCPSTTKTGFLDTAQTKHGSASGITKFVSAKVAEPKDVALAGYKGLKRKQLIVLPTKTLSLQSMYIRMMPPRIMASIVYAESMKG